MYIAYSLSRKPPRFYYGSSVLCYTSLVIEFQTTVYKISNILTYIDNNAIIFFLPPGKEKNDKEQK